MAIESKEFTAEDPSTGEVIWRGLSASSEEIRRACSLAYDGYSICGRAKYEERVALIRAFEAKLKSAKDELTDAIARSTGKPMWESATEVDSMIAKIPISIEAFEKRIVDTKRELPGGVVGETVFKPHGTCAVIGPFNFPGHLPNGHIIPALLAGNAVVFKPSELTPLVADIYVRLWQELGRKSQELLQVVHGGAEVGAELIRSGIDAVFFTGSERGGLAIAKALIDRPGVVQALEMGGNNPLIVGRVENVRAAALATIQSAFITAGQRCSCARRLILIGEQREFMDELLRLTDSIRIGAPKDDPAPFMGPVISEAAADRLFEQWNQMVARGGDVLRPLKSIGSRRNFLSPGIFERKPVQIPNAPAEYLFERLDEEMFGPILQIFRVPKFYPDVIIAAATRFGLCTGLLSDDVEDWNQLQRSSIRAGVISWNRPTTGASSALPFGGLGNSGNGRPSAYFAADYCSHPVAIMRSDKVTMPATLPPGLS